MAIWLDAADWLLFVKVMFLGGRDELLSRQRRNVVKGEGHFATGETGFPVASSTSAINFREESKEVTGIYRVPFAQKRVTTSYSTRTPNSRFATLTRSL